LFVHQFQIIIKNQSMLKELFSLVRESAGDSVINNPDIPNEKNDEVVAEATNTVASGLRNVVAGGGLPSLVSMFNNKGTGSAGLLSNPIVNMMIGHFAGKLMSKYNISGNQASNVASSLIPSTLSNLINKSNDPADEGFSLEKLLRSITGGQTDQVVEEEKSKGNSGFNLQDILSQFSGEGKQPGGGLMDIIGKLAGGARNQQQRNGGGGLMDLIKGFIK
jgi:hypothetical protein